MVPLSLANRPPGSFWRPSSGSFFLSLALDEFFWHPDVMWFSIEELHFLSLTVTTPAGSSLRSARSPRLALSLSFSFSFSPSMSLLCHGHLFPLPVIFFSVSCSALLSVSMCGRERSYWPTFAGLGMAHSLPPLSPGTAQEDPTYSTVERETPRQLPTVNHPGRCWIILTENEGHS